MAKPGSKPFWATTGDKTEPSGSKKATGWLKLEKPPYQLMNWLFNKISEWLDYHSGNAQYNIIVGGDSDERDYATMVAYIADSPSAGDRVSIKGDEVLAATLVIPDGIEVTMLKGNKFTLTTNFSPIIQLGDNVKIKGELRVENSDTGTIAKGFSFNGDSNHSDNLILENKSTGTITDAFYIETGAEGNYSQCRAINSGGGAITNDITDNSGNDENYVTVKGDAGISRSRGAKKFDVLDVTQIKQKKGADIPSASALILGADGNYFAVTGSNTIQSIGTVGIGFEVTLHFNTALTIEHHVTNLILPSGNHIKTKTGDVLMFREYAVGDWELIAANRPIDAKNADIASASALPVLAPGYADVTGTNTITSIDSLGIGTEIKLHFDAILTLTHHSTNLVLPGGANIITAAGDEAEFKEYEAGKWQCTNYSKANGTPVIPIIFGAWANRSNNTVYQAATDGIAVAYTSDGSNLIGLTDSSTPPTTSRQNTKGDPATGDASITLPVRKNDYWKVTGAANFVYWLPITS